MITRSPPVRRAELLEQPASTEGSSGTPRSAPLPTPAALAATSASHLRHSTTRPVDTTPRRPEDAQNEYWVKKMKTVIAERDEARAKATAVDEAKTAELHELHTRFASEKREWQQLCDAFQALHNHNSLKQKIEWGKQRWELRSQQDELSRANKITIIQHDARILQFQNAEFWDQFEINNLQADKAALREEFNTISTTLLEEQETLKVRVSEADGELSAQHELIEELRAENKSLKAELKDSRASLARREAEFEAHAARSEQLQSSLQASQDQINSLNIELARLKKREKTDKRQDTDIEELRAAKVDSDIRLRELEAELKEERARTKGKEKELRDSETVIKNLKAQAKSARVTQAKALDPGEVVDTAPKPRGAATKKQVAPRPQSPELDDEEEDSYQARAPTPSISSDASIHSSPVQQPKPKPKASSKASTSQISNSAPTKKVTKKTATQAAPISVLSDSDDGEAEVPARMKGKLPASQSSTSISQSQPSAKPKPKPVPKFAKKPSPLEQEAPPSPKARGKRRAPDEGPGVKALSQQPRDADPGEAGPAEPPKKKKRALGGFARTTSATWGAQDDNGLGLPSMLSPIVKSAAPARSFSGLRR